MCTLSFLPIGVKDFIFTCNRDEEVTRAAATIPQKQIIQHLEVLCPIDQKSKGSWIAASSNGFALCLMNGGFIKHRSTPPYRKSRGLVLLDFFNFNNVNQFVVNYDFKRIEPFTLIIAEFKSALKLSEVVWDGRQVHVAVKDSKVAQIWSSSALYSKENKMEREQWFKLWKKENRGQLNAESVKGFHLAGNGEDTEQKLVIKRAAVSTLSITQIIKTNEEVEMTYFDLLSKANASQSLNLL